MKRSIVLMIALTLLVSGRPGLAEEKPAKRLEELNAQIQKTPDDPMLHYRKAQCLMKLNRGNEGYETAKQAMALFVKKKEKLAWMLLESIDLNNARVDVHFNMGPRERRPPEIGIIRPISFRIWKKGKGKEQRAELLEIIDFEISTFSGRPVTAALGKMEGRMHINFGILDTGAKYKDIKKKAVSLIKERHPAP